MDTNTETVTTVVDTVVATVKTARGIGLPIACAALGAVAVGGLCYYGYRRLFSKRSSPTLPAESAPIMPPASAASESVVDKEDRVVNLRAAASHTEA